MIEKQQTANDESRDASKLKFRAFLISFLQFKENCACDAKKKKLINFSEYLINAQCFSENYSSSTQFLSAK